MTTRQNAKAIKNLGEQFIESNLSQEAKTTSIVSATEATTNHTYIMK